MMIVSCACPLLNWNHQSQPVLTCYMLLILSYNVMQLIWSLGQVLMWFSVSRVPLWPTCCHSTCTALRRMWEGSWIRLLKRWGWRKSSLSSTPRGQVREGDTLFNENAKFFQSTEFIDRTQVCSSSTSHTNAPRCLCCARTRSSLRRWRTIRSSCRTSWPPSTLGTSWMRCRRGRANCPSPTRSSPSGSRCSGRGPI